MANQISNGNTATTEPPDLKRKLALRMTFAGLMIVALLATLAVFDRLSAPDEPEVQTPRFTEPVPVPKKEITQPVKPAEPPAEVAKNEPKPAEPEDSAVPVDKSQPPLEAPARPEILAQPVLPRTAPSGRSPQAAPQAPATSQASPVRAPETLRRPSRSHLHRCASRCFLPGRRRRRGFFPDTRCRQASSPIHISPKSCTQN